MSQDANRVTTVFHLTLQSIEQLHDPDTIHRRKAQAAGAMAHADPRAAEQTARSITDDRCRDRALREIACSIASTNPPVALEIAETIENSRDRDLALSHIAQYVAPTDPRLATEIANRLTDRACRDAAMATMASCACDGDGEGARTGSRRVRSAAWRAVALAEAASRMEPSSEQTRLALVTEAAEWAKRVRGSAERATTFALVGAAAHPVSPEMGSDLFDEALKSAHAVRSEWDRCETLREVASRIASVDSETAALVAERITDPYFRGLATCDVAEAMLGRNPRRALEFARSVEEPRFRARALSCLAARVGAFNADAARNLLNEATDAADEISDGYWTACAMGHIAEVWAELDLEEAQQVFDPIVKDCDCHETKSEIMMGLARGGARSTVQ